MAKAVWAEEWEAAAVWAVALALTAPMEEGSEEASEVALAAESEDQEAGTASAGSARPGVGKHKKMVNLEERANSDMTRFANRR